MPARHGDAPGRRLRGPGKWHEPCAWVEAMKKERPRDVLDNVADAPLATQPPRASPLRIHVRAGPRIELQARAYAEYRFFAGLAPLGGVRSVRVSLRHIPGGTDAVVCAVAVVLDDGTGLRFRATGTHTYDAINKAVRRLQNDMSVSS